MFLLRLVWGTTKSVLTIICLSPSLSRVILSICLTSLQCLVLLLLHCLGSYRLLFDGLIIIRGLIFYSFLHNPLTFWAFLGLLTRCCLMGSSSSEDSYSTSSSLTP